MEYLKIIEELNLEEGLNKGIGHNVFTVDSLSNIIFKPKLPFNIQFSNLDVSYEEVSFWNGWYSNFAILNDGIKSLKYDLENEELIIILEKCQE